MAAAARLGLVAAPRRDARLRVLPAELPQVFPVRLDAGLLEAEIAALLVPLVLRVQIACVDANARGLVRQFALLVAVLRRHPVVDCQLLVLRRIPAVAFEGVRHGHTPLGLRFGLRRGGRLDGFGEVLARLRAFSHQVEHDAGGVVGGRGIRRRLKFLAISGQGFLQFSLALQLPSLPDKLWLWLPARRLGANGSGGNQDRRERKTRHVCD